MRVLKYLPAFSLVASAALAKKIETKTLNTLYLINHPAQMTKFSTVVLKDAPHDHTLCSGHIIHHATYDTEEEACKAVMRTIKRHQLITHAFLEKHLKIKYNEHCKKLAENIEHSPFCYRRKDMRRKMDAIATRKQLRTFAHKYVPTFNWDWTYQICEVAL